MIVAVLRETLPGERRVALAPAILSSLGKAGLEVVVEAGAGDQAGFPDRLFVEKGARIAATRAEALEPARLILQVRPFGPNAESAAAALDGLRPDHVLVGLLDSLSNTEGVRGLAEKGATGFALELIPRSTRAQAMDVLSSAATVVGYRAVLLAATTLHQLFPMLMTAGGTLAPARVLVVGAGVAGLQAISTARRLGAVVQAYDVRPAVKEQIESLGAKFVELPLETAGTQDAGGYAKAMDESFYRRQRETMSKVIAQSDVVITTAAVPGKKAPVLVTAEMVDLMPPGAVLVDVAAEQGGNCELTRPGETIQRGSVTILGPVNMASQVPHHASQMHGRNVSSFLALIVKDGELRVDLDDEIVRETLVVQDGEVVGARARESMGLAPVPA